MAELAKFISGDGVEHEVEVGSAAFGQMVKNGFQRTDLPAPVAIDEGSEPAKVELEDLSMAQLSIKADYLGIHFAPRTKKAAMIEAIKKAEIADSE